MPLEGNPVLSIEHRLGRVAELGREVLWRAPMPFAMRFTIPYGRGQAGGLILRGLPKYSGGEAPKGRLDPPEASFRRRHWGIRCPSRP
jgi:hypothetical protein